MSLARTIGEQNTGRAQDDIRRHQECKPNCQDRPTSTGTIEERLAFFSLFSLFSLPPTHWYCTADVLDE